MNSCGCNSLLSIFCIIQYLQVKCPSTRSLLGEELENFDAEKLNSFLKNLQKLIKDSVVDINNDAENNYAATQIVDILIEKNIAPSHIVPLVAPIHGQSSLVLFHM